MKFRFLFFLLVCFVVTAQQTKLVVPSFHSETVLKMASSNDGNWVASIGRDDKLKVWFANDGQLYREVDNVSGKGVWFTGDSKYIAFFNLDGKVHVYSMKPFQKVDEILDVEGLTTDSATSAIYWSKDRLQDTYYTLYKRPNPKATDEQLYREDVPYKGTGKVSAYAKVLSVNPENSILLFTHSNKQTQVLDLQKKTATKTYANGYLNLPNQQIFAIKKLETNRFQLYLADYQKNVIWNRTFKLEQYREDYENLLAYDKANHNILFVTNKGILKLDGTTGKELLITTGKQTAVTVAKNGAWIANDDTNSIEIRDPINLGVRKKLDFLKTMHTTYLATSENDFAFTTFSYTSEYAKIGFIRPNGFKTGNTKTALDFSALAFSSDGVFISSMDRNNSGNLRMYNLPENTYRNYLSSSKKNKSGAISPDRNYVAAIGTDMLEVFHIETKEKLFSKNYAGKFARTRKNIAFSQDNSKLIVQDVGHKVGTNYADRTIICYSLPDGKELWQKKLDSDGLSFTDIGKTVVSLDALEGTLYYFDAENGNSKGKKKMEFSGSFKTAYNAAGTLLAVPAYSSNGSVTIVDVANKTIKNTIADLPSNIENVGFLKDDFLIATTKGNDVLLLDAREGKFIGKFYLFENSKDWAFVMNNGLFEASQNAMEKMYYLKDGQKIALERLYQGFYTPNLFEYILNRKPPEPSDIEIDDIKSPPTVSLSYKAGNRNLVVEDDVAIQTISAQTENANIIVNASAPNDRVGALRLYHNGKLITKNTRNLFVTDDDEDNVEKTYAIKLLMGENHFKAIAVNSQGTESSPAELLVSYQPAIPKKIGGLQLHLVVIGIDEYKNPKYNLNYAVADANAFKERISQGMKGITSNINVHVITNAQANKEIIQSKLQTIANDANPQDVFVFYYAGHGVMGSGKDADFYLVPHDVTQLYGNDGALAQRGISAQQLKQIAGGIPAQKQLYILDACQSSGALQTVAVRGAAEEKAIAQLARSTGTHWLTASGSEQFATEFDELGHGVFTYALLEALSGKADSGDNRITVNELKAYIESRVPEISEKYKGSPQYPSSFGFGQDFPVSIKQ